VGNLPKGNVQAEV